jgi:hypothetical protein
MKKIHRYFAVVLFSAGILWAGNSLAQSPFDGTWRTDPSKTTRETKPIVVYTAQGWYHCESCVPSYAAKADGTDQPVSDQAIDTLSVKEVDARTVTFVGKKNGKVAYEVTGTVSADGKTLTRKGIAYPPNSEKPVNFTETYKRIGTLPSGVHAASGQWQDVKGAASENGLVTTYKTKGDELTMTRPTGETYTANFDGKEYPVKGSYVYDTVSLKRLGERAVEETDKLKGKIIEIDTWTVSNDGRTLTVAAVEKPSDRKDTYVLTRVPEKK